MATIRPLPGKCNARLGSGEFCQSEGVMPSLRELGEVRCHTHSLASRQPVVTASQAYEKALMSGAQTATRRLFKMLPRGTNLESEIALVRLRVVELRELLNGGQIWISGGMDSEGQCKIVLVEDLLGKEIGILNGLIRTQAENHPERRVGGNMTLTIKMAGHPMLDADVSEELEADAQKDLPPGDQTVEAVPTDAPADDKFAELDE